MTTAMDAAALLRLDEVRAEIERLRASVEQVKAKVQNGGLNDVHASLRDLVPALKKRKPLTGHASRVLALDWAGDSVHLLSARWECFAGCVGCWARRLL
jgi:hypothetical protein